MIMMILMPMALACPGFEARSLQGAAKYDYDDDNDGNDDYDDDYDYDYDIDNDNDDCLPRL